VAGWVREDIQRLAVVVGAIMKQRCSEFFCSLPVSLKLFHGGNGIVHVQLHRHIRGGPGRARKGIDLLERQSAVPGVVDQYQPVGIIGSAVGRRLVPGAVPQPE
jgi:hypothetical protein